MKIEILLSFFSFQIFLADLCDPKLCVLRSMTHAKAVSLSIFTFFLTIQSNPFTKTPYILSLTQLSMHQQRRSTHPGWSCGDNVCAVVEVFERRKQAVAPSASSQGGMFIVSSVFDLAHLITSCTLYVNCSTATQGKQGEAIRCGYSSTTFHKSLDRVCDKVHKSHGFRVLWLIP